MELTILHCVSAGGSLLAAITLAGCGSHEDSVCQSAGECSQGGSSDWIKSCQGEARALRDEASQAGCRSKFDDYFACADSNYVCQGATPQFRGCDDKRSALDQCLETATTNTSCALLQVQEADCGATTGDAGSDAGLPPACSLARDCQAQCYLAQVSNVCAPRVDELSNVTSCAASCPP
jgi:hypothetical protein